METILTVTHTECNESPAVDAKILDGPAIVNMLRPHDSKTFIEYVTGVIEPYIVHQLQSVARVDLVFDRYFTDSLKSGTRSNRGSGVRRVVKANSSMPNNWSTFLRCDDNKSELFPLIVNKLVQNIDPNNGLFIGSLEDGAVANQYVDLQPLMPCNIEEADERMFIHVKHAAEKCPRILVKTVDSDVVVIALSAFHRIPGIQELWIEFGVGKHLKFIPIHEIAASLGPETSTAYLFFHSFSGCDTTSSVNGKGKASFYETWKKMPCVTPVFERMSSSVGDIREKDIDYLEEFVVTMYCSTFNGKRVNDARRYLFTTRGNAIENIPPTSAALKEHVKRSVLQARKWYNCLDALRVEQDPVNWGWMKDGNKFTPVWSSLPELSSVTKVLIRCGHTDCERGSCKCRKNGLRCTELCGCQGKC